MARNNADIERTATRVKQLVVGPSRFAKDSPDFGTRPDRVGAIIYVPPSSTKNALEIRTLTQPLSSSVLLASIDQLGNVTGSGVKEVIVSIPLTAANLKALVGTPITLVAALGANTFIEVFSAVLFYVFGTVQYTGGHTNGFNVFVKNSAGMAMFSLDSTQIASATGSKVFPLVPGNGGGLSDTNANAVNQGIILQGATTDLATGDGTAFLHIGYRIHASNA